MISVVRSGWQSEFNGLLSEALNSLVLCSPFVGEGPCRDIASNSHLTGRAKELTVYMITNLSPDNVLSGATDPAALLRLSNMFPRFVLRFLPGLHAKVYIADERRAIITSANLTHNGLARNYEYGVSISDAATVAEIRNDIYGYGELGSVVDAATLNAFQVAASDLRALRKEAEKKISGSLKKEFEKKLAKMELDVLRARTGGQSSNQIFVRTILYVLKGGPLTTPQINDAVSAIHPDICDDTVDRVIDGRHFGKKWKHSVRNAQQQLKRDGRITLSAGLWWLKQP